MIADPLALIRAAHFAATLLTSGTVFFAAFVIGSTRLPQNFPILRTHMNVLVWTGLALSVLTGAMWVIWLAANILGESLAEVWLHGGAWSVLADTRFGWICCLRLVLAALLGLSCSTRRSAPGQLLSRLRSSLCPLSRATQAQHRACGAMSMSSPTRCICSRLVAGLEGCLHSCCCCGPPAGEKAGLA